MNYCTKCSSYYQQPGTCNCYAGGAGDGWVHPVYPEIPVLPTTGTPIPQPPWTITACGPTNAADDWVPFVHTDPTTLSIH